MTSLAASMPSGRAIPGGAVRAVLKLADAPGVLRRRRFTGLRDKFYRNMWQGAARAVGATIHTGPDGLSRISRDGLATFVRRSDLMLDSALSIAALADKTQTYDLMAEKGVRVPDHAEFSLAALDLARDFLARHPAGVVVKPATGTGGGRGVTTAITANADLTRAARHAGSFNPRLLIEPMLEGRSYRLLYLDGRLIDAVRRDPPVVTGDGKSTIRALVRRENARRLGNGRPTALSPLAIDRDARIHLAAQGLSTTARPEAGQTVTLKRVVNENAAAQNHNVLADVHPKIAGLGAALMRDLGVRFAGLDLIAPDLTRPLRDSGGMVGEININPGLHHHYLIARPESGQPVAARVLEHMFTEQTGVMRL